MNKLWLVFLRKFNSCIENYRNFKFLHFHRSFIIFRKTLTFPRVSSAGKIVFRCHQALNRIPSIFLPSSVDDYCGKLSIIEIPKRNVFLRFPRASRAKSFTDEGTHYFAPMSPVLACQSRAILRHLRSLFHGLDWLVHFNIIFSSMQFVFAAGKSIKFKTMSAMPLKNTISGNFQDRVKLSNLFMFRLAVSCENFPKQKDACEK